MKILLGFLNGYNLWDQHVAPVISNRLFLFENIWWFEDEEKPKGMK